MEYIVEFEGHDIVFTTQLSRIRELNAQQLPCVLILDDDNQKEDTFEAKFAVSNAEDLGDEASDFLRRVAARCCGIPLKIFETDRLIIRELCDKDAYDTAAIYNESDGFLEPFWTEYETCKESAGKIELSDLAEHLKTYAQTVYDFKGYGIFGITLKQKKAAGKDGYGSLIGLVGLTDTDLAPVLKTDDLNCDTKTDPAAYYHEQHPDYPGQLLNYRGQLPDSRGQHPDYEADITTVIIKKAYAADNLELGFALKKEYRGCGYAAEACRGAIAYAAEHFPGCGIVIRTKADNAPAAMLAQKLFKEFS